MDVISNFLTGGIAGFATSIFGKFMDAKEEKSKREHELKMRAEDREDLKEQAALQLKTFEVKTSSELEIEARKSEQLTESNLHAERLSAIEADKASYTNFFDSGNTPAWALGFNLVLMTFVDFVRGLTRPVLTVMLVIYSFILENSGKSENEIAMLAGSAVGYWFGDRSRKNKK